MNSKNSVLVTGFVLWVLGILVGAGAGEVIPGQFSVPATTVLAVALLASLGNFVVLYRRAQ